MQTKKNQEKKLSKPNLTDSLQVTQMPLVIACGDEGVQINFGRRLAFLGAGLKLKGFDQVLVALRQMITVQPNILDQKLRLVANEENAYVKEVLDLNDFDEANASMQQHLQALADQENLLYAGILPFADPLELNFNVKGHMVRPRNIHVANKICFTLAGGETTYNLGQYLISADWLAFANQDLAKSVLDTQVKFYEKLAERPLKLMIEEQGDLPSEIVAKNKAILLSLGYNFS
ncbi:MAG TPA: hypothetical protein PLQ50_01210 [Candidatus Woesebacteria bacterium]|nr:hypothetical protein [Candidatus Woesebacteria bacterium]